MSVFIVICFMASLWTGGYLREAADIHQVIVRGTPIKIEEAPFVALYGGEVLIPQKGPEYNSVGQPKTTTFRCSASIVTQKHLISAAHCGKERMCVTERYVIVGSDNVEKLDQKFTVDTVTYHPRYNSALFINDILVIKLVKSLTFNSRVQPIALAERDLVIPSGAMLTTMGYGITLDDDRNTYLNKISIPYVEPDTCERLISSKIDRRSMICAGEHPFMNTCLGDSGGPLVYNSTLVGVVSHGKIHERAKVFSRVSALRDFIDAVIENSDLD